MKVTLILCVFLIAIPVWAGTFRDNFDDGNYDGWTVYNYVEERKMSVT